MKVIENKEFVYVWIFVNEKNVLFRMEKNSANRNRVYVSAIFRIYIIKRDFSLLPRKLCTLRRMPLSEQNKLLHEFLCSLLYTLNYNGNISFKFMRTIYIGLTSTFDTFRKKVLYTCTCTFVSRINPRRFRSVNFFHRKTPQRASSLRQQNFIHVSLMNSHRFPTAT